MPALSQHQSTKYIKALVMGDSGSGKSGAQESLIRAGYKLRVLDWDNGLDPLFHYAKSKCPDKLGNVYFETCTDKMKAINGIIIPDGIPKAWTKGMQLLTHWKMPEFKDPVTGEVFPAYDLGKPSDWGPDCILSLDTMSFMSLAAMRHVLAVNGRSGQQPFQSDWGEAMRLVENCLSLLYADNFQTNVLVTSHITFLSNEGDQVLKGLPMSIGQKLSPKIGRYFNTVLMTKTKGSGSSAKRVIYTRSEGLVELKNPAPTKVLPEYPLEDGLAEIFKALHQ